MLNKTTTTTTTTTNGVWGGGGGGGGGEVRKFESILQRKSNSASTSTIALSVTCGSIKKTLKNVRSEEEKGLWGVGGGGALGGGGGRNGVQTIQVNDK